MEITISQNAELIALLQDLVQVVSEMREDIDVLRQDVSEALDALDASDAYAVRD